MVRILTIRGRLKLATIMSRGIRLSCSFLLDLVTMIKTAPIKHRSDLQGKKIVTFTGEEILWDQDNHIYRDLEGNVLLSGSKYAEQLSPKFDMDVMLPKTAQAWGVDENELRSVWKMNSERKMTG